MIYKLEALAKAAKMILDGMDDEKYHILGYEVLQKALEDLEKVDLLKNIKKLIFLKSQIIRAKEEGLLTCSLDDDLCPACEIHKTLNEIDKLSP